MVWFTDKKSYGEKPEIWHRKSTHTKLRRWVEWSAELALACKYLFCSYVHKFHYWSISRNGRFAGQHPLIFLFVTDDISVTFSENRVRNIISKKILWATNSCSGSSPILPSNEGLFWRLWDASLCWPVLSLLIGYLCLIAILSILRILQNLFVLQSGCRIMHQAKNHSQLEMVYVEEPPA